MNWWTRQQLLSKDPDIRRQAVEKIATHGGPGVAERLAERIEDENEDVALTAIRAVGRLKTSGAVKSLATALRHPSPRVSEASAETLCLLGTAQAAEVLAGGLLDSRAATRSRAADALGRLGWQPETSAQAAALAVAQGRFSEAEIYGAAAVEPFLLALLERGSSSPRADIVEALGRLRDDRSLPGLLDALADPDAAVRQAAAGALGSLGHAQALAPLAVALKDGFWEVRRAAAAALGRLGGTEAVGPLADALADQDREVREAAVSSLDRLGDPAGIKPLVVALADPEIDIRQAAATALYKIDSAWERSDAARLAAPELKRVLADRDYWVRQAAADVLRKLSEVQAAQTQAKSRASSSVLRHRAAIPVLIETLADGDRDLRLAAAEALARINDTRALASLRKALQDPDHWVREACQLAVERLSGSAGKPVPSAPVSPP